ncbi:hypothetical protein DYU11_20735 [Fibrisoma montanum]|uniref:Lipocalin-like domain-containing protein n=1 Tax=Fibrisoma montanum TaxID=2305895 RepID=A0A418M3S9_9BACT|nr:hypothetical protein [Fibrisoma montanum]RIV20476.1 hypothetical protein DYU11_20735 [Fibrisoma montanum]
MKTTNLKLVAFFVLVGSVLAGCSKSNSDPEPDPKPDPNSIYLGIYKVTVTESITRNGVLDATTNTRVGTVSVSKGSMPNTLLFTDDLAVLKWRQSFEVTLVGDAFKLPAISTTYINSAGAGKFTPNGLEMSTTQKLFGSGALVEETSDIKGTKF